MIPSRVASRTVTNRHARREPARAAGGCDGRRGDRGAVLVHAAVAMMGLLAFSALSIDLGTLWVARGQAQNAVDAAALAGGVSLAGQPRGPVPARRLREAIALEHAIWGEPVAPGVPDAGDRGVSGRLAGHSRRLRRGGGRTQQCQRVAAAGLLLAALRRGPHHVARLRQRQGDVRQRHDVSAADCHSRPLGREAAATGPTPPSSSATSLAEPRSPDRQSG